jgi:hypothetical protein
MAMLTDLWQALDRLGDARAAAALRCSLSHLRNLRDGRRVLHPDQASRLARAVGWATAQRRAVRAATQRPTTRDLADRLLRLVSIVAHYRHAHPEAYELPTLGALDTMVEDLAFHRLARPLIARAKRPSSPATGKPS